MSRRTFKCNNIQQNVMSQTPNLKKPIKPKKPNKTQKNPPGWFFFKTRVFPNPVVRVVLIWPSGPRLAALVVAHWGGNRRVPWPLVLRLLASLPDQPPPPDHRENHLIWVDSIPMVPLARCEMSLECPVGTRKFPMALVMLSLQLWN